MKTKANSCINAEPDGIFDEAVLVKDTCPMYLLPQHMVAVWYCENVCEFYLPDPMKAIFSRSSDK